MLVSIILCVTQVGFPSKLVCESLPLRTLPQIMFPIRSNVKEGREGKGKGREGEGMEGKGQEGIKRKTIIPHKGRPFYNQNYGT